MAKVDDKREAILQATLKLVSEHGFHGTAMSKVAREAGVSAGIIYHYFKNKDELLVQLYFEMKQRGVAEQMANHDPSQPLRAQIRRLWGAMIRYHIEHPQVTAFMSQFMSSPYFTPEVQEQSAAYFKSASLCYEKAREEMIIQDMPQAVFATFALDVPAALVQRQSTGQLELTDEVVEQVIESLWQAIRL